MTTQSDVNDLLWLARQIAEADYSPLVTKFAEAVIAKAEALEVGLRVLAPGFCSLTRLGSAYCRALRPQGDVGTGATLLEALRKLDEGGNDDNTE